MAVELPSHKDESQIWLWRRVSRLDGGGIVYVEPFSGCTRETDRDRQICSSMAKAKHSMYDFFDADTLHTLRYDRLELSSRASPHTYGQISV